MANLVVREDIFLGNVNACPESKHLEGKSIVDDSNSSVPVGIQFSDTFIDDKGVHQEFYLRNIMSSSIEFTILYCNSDCL